MSTNQRIYQTIMKATHNIYLSQTNMQSISELAIKQLLPKYTSYNSFALNLSHSPKHAEFTIESEKFIVYTSPNNTGIFSCFTKKAKVKNLTIYAYSFSIVDEESKLLEYFVDFSSLQVQMKSTEKKLIFSVKVSDNKQKSFAIYFSNHEQADYIQGLLQNALNNGIQMKTPTNYLCTVHNCFGSIAMNLEEFERVCNTGDILLFKKKLEPPRKESVHSIKNPIKKEINVDEQAYEHVAIIVRNKDNQILILEKNEKGNIGINYWLNIVNREWYKKIDKIVFRKLQMQRTFQFYTLFQTQLIKCLDKHFKTDLLSIYNIQPDTSFLTFQQQTPFKCGDFVAQFYNKCKLIVLARQSIHFWPNDFTNKREFPFVKEKGSGKQVARFGPESIIVFKPKDEMQIELKI